MDLSLPNEVHPRIVEGVEGRPGSRLDEESLYYSSEGEGS